jgi:hypothetical protein
MMTNSARRTNVNLEQPSWPSMGGLLVIASDQKLIRILRSPVRVTSRNRATLSLKRAPPMSIMMV